jgi:hypothetical protein
MKRIEATIGYREEHDNGEVRYYSAYSGNGYCYKDDEAFKTGNGVCYIREAAFIDAKEDYNRDYLTLEQIEKDEEDGYTRGQIISAARDYFNNEIPEGYPYTEQFLSWVALVCYDMVSWEGIDILLDELTFDDFQEEDAKPFPWNWKPEN